MKVLLDTHTFLWWDSDASKLSSRAQTILADRSNTRLLSTASIWEIVIKVGLGKLTLTRPLRDIVNEQRRRNGVKLLHIRPSHAYAVASLPTPHYDPFDRLLAAQTIVEKADLLSKDPIFAQYPIRVIW